MSFRAMKQRDDLTPGGAYRTWFWLGTAAVVVIALIARWALYLEQNSFVRLQRTYELIIMTDELVTNLTGVEASALEYLSTSEQHYLNRYRAANVTLEQTLDQLPRIVQDDPEQRARVEELRRLIGTNLDHLSACIRGRSSMGSGASVRALADRGRSMEEIRKLIGDMKHDEQDVLERYSRTRESRLRTGLAALAGSVLLASCCLLLGQTILRRNVSRRQKAEEGLDFSEKRFEILCEQAPVGIYETDAQGMCVYVNPRWTQMSGLTAADSLGHRWTKVLHPDDRATVLESWQAAAMRGASWEYRLTPPQGGLRWIRALGGPMFSSRGELIGYVGTLEDITEGKLAARALQDREVLNRAVLNSLPANIAVLKDDGTIQTANEAWQQFREEKPSPPACFVGPGVNYLDVCKKAASAGSAVAERAVNGIEKVLRGTLPSFAMQYLCEMSAGKKWFHMVVTPLSGVTNGGAVITHVDVTRRKQAEERFRLVVEATPSALIVADQQGKVLLVNSRAESLFGFQRPELLGRSMESLVPRSLVQQREDSGNELFTDQQGHPTGTGNLYAIRKDGVSVPVEVGLSPIETEEGAWMLSSIIDITERQRADLALRESRRELRALAGRLMNVQEEERRRISRQLHDDLSQKLALLAFDTTNLLLSPPGSRDELDQALRSVQARLLQLSQDVRQIAHQLHPSILEDLGLAAALHDLCEEFSAREGIRAVCTQEGMPERIPKEVASCLYGVTQEAMHNISKHARASEVSIKVEGGSEGIRLSIHDNGLGFDQQAAASRHGLGIISMKERVRLVQGDFSIQSQPGKGSTVIVLVPLSEVVR